MKIIHRNALLWSDLQCQHLPRAACLSDSFKYHTAATHDDARKFHARMRERQRAAEEARRRREAAETALRG